MKIVRMSGKYGDRKHEFKPTHFYVGMGGSLHCEAGALESVRIDLSREEWRTLFSMAIKRGLLRKAPASCPLSTPA